MGVRYEAVNIGRRGISDENEDDDNDNIDNDDLESAGDPKLQAINKKSQQNHNHKQRLVSLDVFRGLTVALMILVDDVGGVFPCINHSPWNGLTLADYVMPFFLFIVGVSLSLTYNNNNNNLNQKLPRRPISTKNALLRFLKLLLLGLLLQGGFFHGINHLTYGVDILHMRWMGILQRIAIAYLVAALCEIWLKGDGDVNSGATLFRNYQLQWGVSLMLSILYITALYGLYVPDWEYQIAPRSSLSPPITFLVKCGVRGETGPACNAAGMIDRKILGIHHLYTSTPVYARTPQCSIKSPDYGPLPPNAPSWCQAPFDPEGILSSVMAIVTCLIGLHFGHIIVHFKEHRDRVHQWVFPSCVLILFGISLHYCFGMQVNKALYSLSYMCVTSGVAGILLAAIYLMVEVWGYKQRIVIMILKWMGMNALIIYVVVACNIIPIVLQGFYFDHPHNNILSLIGIGASNAKI